MKRYNNLWHQIIQFENILQAARQAQRGKRFRDNVLAFNYNLEIELARIQTELETKTYHPGGYRTFEIVEPKRRMISAAPYRDRVVHHALCNIIVPIFERTFIADSYANRVGFGTHRALQSMSVLQLEKQPSSPNPFSHWEKGSKTLKSLSPWERDLG